MCSLLLNNNNKDEAQQNGGGQRLLLMCALVLDSIGKPFLHTPGTGQQLLIWAPCLLFATFRRNRDRCGLANVSQKYFLKKSGQIIIIKRKIWPLLT